VVQNVGGLVVDALVGLLARGAGDLLGLLHDLVAGQPRVVEQLHRVGALGPSRLAVGRVRSSTGSASCGAGGSSSPLWKHVRSPVWQAGPFGLDERQHSVAVAVHAQRADLLRVARGRALVPELVARAAPEVQLAGLARARERLLVRIGQGEDLSPSAKSWMTTGTSPRSS
jgi:hypothetical protein